MAQRSDERAETKKELAVYEKALKLSGFVMSVCKPKDKNVNTKHISKKNAGIGKIMMEAVVELGADILEANHIYIGQNIDIDSRIKNYSDRIKLQDKAKCLTFRLEHVFRILHYDRPFAESTTSYMMDLISETRDLLTAWRESELKALKRLIKER